MNSRKDNPFSISHIRLQESDRIAAIVENLTALGVHVEEEPDGVVIYPQVSERSETGKLSLSGLQPAVIQTYDDHRLAMGFAITGLRSSGVTILDPLCCRKTFENYFDVLEETIREIQGE